MNIKAVLTIFSAGLFYLISVNCNGLSLDGASSGEVDTSQTMPTNKKCPEYHNTFEACSAGSMTLANATVASNIDESHENPSKTGGASNLKGHSRSVSFDSRYLTRDHQQQDIRGLMTFGKDLATARGALLDYFTENSTTTMRIWRFIAIELAGHILYEEGFQTSIHEQGHGSRFGAVGTPYEFDDGSKSFFPYFFSRFGNNDSNAFTGTKLNAAHFTTKEFLEIGEPLEKDKFNVMVSGAGINAQIAYSEYLQNAIYYDGGSICLGLGMMKGKFGLLDYVKEEESLASAGNDIKHILDSYKNLDIDVDKDDMDRGGLLAVLLSASTWRYFWSVFNFMKTGDSTMTALEYHGFRVPDTSCYQQFPRYTRHRQYFF